MIKAYLLVIKHSGKFSIYFDDFPISRPPFSAGFFPRPPERAHLTSPVPGGRRWVNLRSAVHPAEIQGEIQSAKPRQGPSVWGMVYRDMISEKKMQTD